MPAAGWFCHCVSVRSVVSVPTEVGSGSRGNSRQRAARWAWWLCWEPDKSWSTVRPSLRPSGTLEYRSAGKETEVATQSRGWVGTTASRRLGSGWHLRGRDLVLLPGTAFQNPPHPEMAGPPQQDCLSPLSRAEGSGAQRGAETHPKSLTVQMQSQQCGHLSQML